MVSSETIQPIAEECRGVHDFFKDINPKGIVIAWLEFELTYYDVEV